MGVGNGVNDNDGLMSYTADSAGGQYFWTGDGLGIDAIFQDIGQRLVDIVAVRLGAGTPMIYDVLAPGAGLGETVSATA